MKAARAAGAVASGGVGGGERERRELRPWTDRGFRFSGAVGLRGLRKRERETL